ncbi:MAG: bifunctional methylenetetrahydrofolate dehydrogenase/methenyltetrahydrofolate cyclohydrolase FolD [Chloroflexota bacterium]
MSAKVIDGKETAAAIRSELKHEVERFHSEHGYVPGLAVVLVGNNPASETYVKSKAKGCKEVGMYSEVHKLPEETTQDELVALIAKLNADPKLHGILVQLPLPKQIDEKTILNLIDPGKDVDGFHPVNVGKLMIGEHSLLPCTPAGCIELIERSGTDITGKSAVVIGRSNIVGKPVAMLLLHKNATVTICHSKTRDLKEVCRRADILVAAIGKPKFVTADMIKPGAVVIDVGINRVEGKIVGDVDYEAAAEVAGAITPVPGGVGPMTITMLLKNTLEAAREAAR